MEGGGGASGDGEEVAAEGCLRCSSQGAGGAPVRVPDMFLFFFFFSKKIIQNKKKRYQACLFFSLIFFSFQKEGIKEKVPGMCSEHHSRYLTAGSQSSNTHRPCAVSASCSASTTA